MRGTGDMWVLVQDKKPRKVPDSYFEEAPPQDDSISFTDMNISRPILKVWSHAARMHVLHMSCTCLAHGVVQAVALLGYVTPTPIQASTVPVALMGKDICACAATGTGESPTAISNSIPST